MIARLAARNALKWRARRALRGIATATIPVARCVAEDAATEANSSRVTMLNAKSCSAAEFINDGGLELLKIPVVAPKYLGRFTGKGGIFRSS